MFEHVTNTRYIPLALLYGVGGRMQFVDLMNQAVTLSGLDVLQTKALLKTMRGQSLISCDFSAGSYVQLEQPGAELYLSLRKESLDHRQRLHEAAVESAKQERNHRTDKNIAIIAALVPLVVLVVEFLITHSAELVEKISALFH